MSVVICAKCGRYVDSDRDEVSRWLETGDVICERQAASDVVGDQHQRHAADPEDVHTIYGRLLWRVRQAKLTHGIRAVLWHQGENDQGADGPSGLHGWQTYRDHFVEMAAGQFAEPIKIRLDVAKQRLGQMQFQKIRQRRIGPVEIHSRRVGGQQARLAGGRRSQILLERLH